MQFSITISGDKQVSRNLADAAIKISNMQPVIEEVLKIIDKRVDNIFDSEGSALENSSWSGLSDATNQARTKKTGYYKRAGGGGILHWTGNLRNSRIKISSKNKGLFGLTAKNDKGKEYAQYHQTGGGRLPKRAVLEIDNKTESLIEKEFQKACEKALQARPF